jgi:hypothetical protein
MSPTQIEFWDTVEKVWLERADVKIDILEIQIDRDEFKAVNI